MDLFNTMYWAYDDGRYTFWGSVYPPLGFFILKFINFVFDGSYYGDPSYMRDNSAFVIFGFGLVYLLVPVLVLKTRYWQGFLGNEKFLIYFVIVLSTPMLFALERGNMIVLAPILLALALSRIGFLRVLCIALLINIKPYFALLMIYYLVRRNWKGFATCSLLSGLIFVITGLALDNHFLNFFMNLLSFSQEDGLFSLREVMGMPSSISAFSYVLKSPDGSGFASAYLSSEMITNIVNAIETAKWAVLIFSLATLIKKSILMRDAEIFCLLLVLITNLGIWVGGYSLILYIVLIPVFSKLRASSVYFSLVAIIAMPIDIIPLIDDFIGQQNAYLSDSMVDIQWTMGLGSVARPLVNIMLLLILSYEILMRKHKLVSDKIEHRGDFLFGGYGLEGKVYHNV
ncbi:MAG: glycosyltransferase 87 family protein [bacterium]|nr:glycosyltransferase 87 family protein [bacterium]